MATPAFDAQASGYDDVATSALGVELRRRVRLALLEVITEADVVIDLGCGTGLDATWLAPQVASVIAVEPSAEMIALAGERCAGHSNVVLHQSAAEDFVPAEPADVVLANFGVVNCVGDLGEFGEHLATVLKPNGHAVLVTMPMTCPLELAAGAARFNKDLLMRRRRSTSPDYPGVHLRYASATSLAASVGPGLQLVHAEALGLFLPPFEQRSWVEHRPRLLRSLANADQRLSSLGARLGMGDHHIAVFRAKP